MEQSAPPRRRTGRLVLFGLAMVALVGLAARADVVWQFLSGHRLAVTGAPVAATHPKLSEHNIEWVREQEPQAQMEFLLGAAIRYEQGATELIEEYLGSWRGQLTNTPEWDVLTKTALYTRDLRVRAAAMEINLAVLNYDVSEASAERLIGCATDHEDHRAGSLWALGILANRGVQVERIFDLLVEYTYDPVEDTRVWAVEGLAHIGTDDTIPEFVRVLGTDPSMFVRERAGCSLAKSGMLARAQRMKAVPGLLDLADDPHLEDKPRKWVYQALREITDVSLPDDPTEWRYWYAEEGEQTAEAFAAEPWQVLGNH